MQKVSVNVERRSVHVLGSKIHYETAGEGCPVVLLHGLGGSTLSWRGNTAPLSERFRVVALDLPGHGYSEPPSRPPTLPVAMQYLNGFLDALALDRVSLVGNSMGALLALRFALESPGRVGRLALVDSAGLGGNVALFLRMMSLPALGELLSRPSRSSMQGLLRVIFYDASRIPSGLDEEMYQVRLLPGRRETLLEALRSGVTLLGQKRSVLHHHRLPELSMPVLVVWGSRDRLVPVQHGQHTARSLRDGRLAIIPDCGHWPQMEQAEQFNHLMVNFLSTGTLTSGPDV